MGARFARQGRALWFALGFSLVPLVVTRAAKADEANTDPKTEARERFGRGLRLFNDGDNSGALAEFKRAYELSPHPAVALNIALVYAAMGRAVEAVQVLDELLKAPGNLAPDKLEKAKSTRADQKARIAELSVEANVEVGELEIDGVKVAKLPLKAALQITSGSRIVGIVAPGHVPQRREVTVAGGARASLRFELLPMEGRMAQLAVKSRIRGATVVIDGEPVGKTPLATTVALSPGDHVVELRRPGYVTARQNARVGKGALGEVVFELEEDPQALAELGGRLALDLSEPDAGFSIDGKFRGAYVEPVVLAAGPHDLVVTRPGFEPVSRSVEVGRAGTTTQVRVQLEPTPQYRMDYQRKANLFRSWGWVGVIGGSAAVGVGTGYLIWNKGKKDDALSDADLAKSNRDRKVGVCATGTQQGNPDECNRQVDVALEIYDNARSRDVFGWVTVGVGAAALATGTVLLLTGDDPHRYELERPEIAKPRVLPTLFRDGKSTGLGVVGWF